MCLHFKNVFILLSRDTKTSPYNNKFKKFKNMRLFFNLATLVNWKNASSTKKNSPSYQYYTVLVQMKRFVKGLKNNNNNNNNKNNNNN